MYTYEKNHTFVGKWITDGEFSELAPRNVFHREKDKLSLDCSEHRDRHILFRARATIDKLPTRAELFITADDFYKLYVNGRFVTFGPASSYHSSYNYNTVDVSDYLVTGENVIAIHTLYHGMINRVFQSGDNRHGLIFDLVLDGKTVLVSDESVLTARHTGYTETGTVGYNTQFLERYDARASEVGFERSDFDDSGWEHARLSKVADHTLISQRTEALVTERVLPVSEKREVGGVLYDFGSNLVGYLCVLARGRSGDVITVRQGQELNGDGSLRYELRANCIYEEEFVLGDGESMLDQYDYKAARYAYLLLPDGCEITDIYFTARHYPFELTAKMKPEYESNEQLCAIFRLCVNTQKYGAQDALLDCMEREKGTYLGDGCYTALTHAILTGKDDMIRKLIDDAFATDFITDTLLICLNCSFMQEIAEFPLMLVKLVLWHYRLTGDKEYLSVNYGKVTRLLDAYRRDYECEHLLDGLDKWCVVEWPANFRDGYDVDLDPKKICHPPHAVMNAHYIEAIATANKIAEALGLSEYIDISPLRESYIRAFYDKERRLFRDAVGSEHISIIGNVFPFAYGLCPSDDSRDAVLAMIRERGISSVSLFAAFPMLEGLVRLGLDDDVRRQLLDEGAWLRMLREDATTTFEGWGKDTKWNTSLFHTTMSYAAVFLADIDTKKLLM